MDAEQEIRRQIGDRGCITFAEFMEVALYWPEGGYYSRNENIGAQGDFYTSPAAHPAFGALFALQLLQMWQLMDRPSPFWVIEMGAGNGLLCSDVIRFCSQFPSESRQAELWDSLRYLCLDRSAGHGLEGELASPERSKVARITSSSIPLRNIAGCFLSNELVDAFPVHQVAMEGGQLREVYVALQDERLVEHLDTPSTPALAERLESVGVSLNEGFRTEVNLAIGSWIDDVAAALERGFVLTVDYGWPAAELYSPQRRSGTLTCYHQHIQVNDPYQRIGRQDITAQVDFTSLAWRGQQQGLDTLGFTTQSQYLHNLGLGQLMGRLRSEGLGQREVDANRMGILDLARSGGMGDFKVLVQGKDVGSPSLWGLEASPEAESILQQLPIPLRSAGHTPLLEGRYPHTGYDWEKLGP